jgi:hypothetical protein
MVYSTHEVLFQMAKRFYATKIGQSKTSLPCIDWISIAEPSSTRSKKNLRAGLWPIHD